MAPDVRPKTKSHAGDPEAADKHAMNGSIEEANSGPAKGGAEESAGVGGAEGPAKDSAAGSGGGEGDAEGVAKISIGGTSIGLPGEKKSGDNSTVRELAPPSSAEGGDSPDVDGAEVDGVTSSDGGGADRSERTDKSAAVDVAGDDEARVAGADDKESAGGSKEYLGEVSELSMTATTLVNNLLDCAKGSNKSAPSSENVSSMFNVNACLFPETLPELV